MIRILAWFKKGSGTFVRSTLRAVPAKVPDPFLNHARILSKPTLAWPIVLLAVAVLSGCDRQPGNTGESPAGSFQPLSEPEEPTAGGKTLSQWMDQLPAEELAECQEAMDALTEIGEEAVPILAQTLTEAEYIRLKSLAADTLGQIGPAASPALEQLGKALDDKDCSVRCHAIQALGKIGPEAVPLLREALVADHPHTRTGVVDALGEMRPTTEAAMAGVAKSLGDADDKVRSSAAAALLGFGPSAVPALAGAIRDGDQRTRQEADSVLGALGPQAMEALHAALADEDFVVRLRIVSALAKLGPPSIPILIETLDDQDFFVRRQATDALGLIGADALPALVKILHDGSDNAQAGAAGALGRMGPAAEPAIGDLIGALENGGAQVRTAAAAALGEFGPLAGGATEALTKALEDPAVSRAAAHALERIGSEVRQESD